MAFSNSTGISVPNGTFNEVHHGGTQINGPQINHFGQSASRFEIYCQRRIAGAAFNSSERHPPSRCLPNTRVGIREKIVQWYGGDPDHQICWLKGPAGSGKSAIAQTIAEGCSESGELAGSFFFCRGSVGRCDISGFVPTVAYQLSISVPSTKPLMESALYLDPSIPDQTYLHQFKKLVVDPLLALRALASPKVVVIDALDECDSESSIEELLVLLANASQNDRLPLRFFLTSRADRVFFEESAIRSGTYYLDLEEFDARDDIRTFFEARLSMIYAKNHLGMRDVPLPWPTRSDLDQLVARSSGSFSLATTIVKLINDGSDLPHRRLRTVLETGSTPSADQRVETSTSSQGAPMSTIPRLTSVQLRAPESKLSDEHHERKPPGMTTLRPPPPQKSVAPSGPLLHGQYTITNVRFKNLAVLLDSNKRSCIVAQPDHCLGDKWDIEPSNGGYYSIQSHDHGTLMVSSDVPRKGDNIYRYTDTFANLWEVKETTVTGHYTISPSLGSNLFWGLADGEIDTPVTLESSPNNPKNQWFFTEVAVKK